MPVAVLRDLDSRPPAGQLGLVFYEDAFVACDAYEHELARSAALERLRRLDAAHRRSRRKIQWRAKVLVSNRNLLVVADVLAVNKGFAKANPDMVRGLVHGILEGNRRLRDQPAQNIGASPRHSGGARRSAR